MNRDVEEAAVGLGPAIEGLTKQFKRLQSENRRLTLALEAEKEKTADLQRKLAARIPGNFHEWAEEYGVSAKGMLELNRLFGIEEST